MTNPDKHRHVEIRDGDQTVASADVTTTQQPEATAQASLRAAPGHIAPGTRASLVDTVMDLPEVQESQRLQAALPLGDSESLGRLRERCQDATTRAAGASALLDADIPQEPGAE
jgi:hypothetical protein